MQNKAFIISWITISILIQVIIGSADGKSKQRQKIRTGDLCAGNPKHGDPTTKGGSGSNTEQDSIMDLKFIPSCATCVSKVAISGGTCYANTWTFKTHCQCDTQAFESCHCWRALNVVGFISYIVLPIITVLIIIVLQICMRHSKCPIAKMEAELHKNLKNQAYLKKHGLRGGTDEFSEETGSVK